MGENSLKPLFNFRSLWQQKRPHLVRLHHGSELRVGVEHEAGRAGHQKAAVLGLLGPSGGVADVHRHRLHAARIVLQLSGLVRLYTGRGGGLEFKGSFLFVPPSLKEWCIDFFAPGGYNY